MPHSFIKIAGHSASWIDDYPQKKKKLWILDSKKICGSVPIKSQLQSCPPFPSKGMGPGILVKTCIRSNSAIKHTEFLEYILDDSRRHLNYRLFATPCLDWNTAGLYSKLCEVGFAVYTPCNRLCRSASIELNLTISWNPDCACRPNDFAMLLYIARGPRHHISGNSHLEETLSAGMRNI